MSQEGGEGAAGKTDPPSGDNQQTDKPTLESISEMTGGKFTDAKGMFASYTELQRKLTEVTQSKPQGPSVIFDLAGAAQVAELDMETIESHLNANGDLSEEQYKALESKGIDAERAKALAQQHRKLAEADSYMADRAKHQAYDKAAETVGGVDKLNAMFQWAQANLNGDQIQSIRARLENTETAEYAARELAGYVATSGATAPAIVAGQRAGSPTPQPFQSNSEKLKVMEKLRGEGIDPFKDPGFLARLGAGVANRNPAGVR